MIASLIVATCLQAPASDPVAVDLGVRVQHLAVAGLDDSRLGHLLSIEQRTIKLLEGGEVPSIKMEGSATLWTLADLNGDGTDEFVVLVDGQSLHKLRMVDGALSFSEPIASGLGGLPPRGCNPSDFLYDLNGDRHPDLSLPVGDSIRLWLGDGEGFVEGPNLGALSTLRLDTGNGLMSSVSRRLVVPRLSPEDVSGDGYPDLVVNDGSSVRQYVSNAGGFPAAPTRTLDLARFRADTSDLKFDLGNLTSSVKYLVQDKWADLDGDGDLDVMILADGMVRVFLGSEDGVDISKGKPPLKVRGNVFYIYAARIDKDDVPDLVLVRVEDLGVGTLFKAALFSWEINFDFLVFRGRGDGRFETRVFRERKATLQGDSLLSIYKEERDQFSELRRKIVRMADFNGDGERTDLVTLDSDGTLQVWLDLISDESVLHSAIEKFLQQTLSGNGNLEVDISTLTQWTLGRTSAMTSVAEGVKPDIKMKLQDWSEPHAMTVRDLDGDGREEILALRLFAPEEGAKRLVGFKIRL
ncbi:MAG: hypothetical protein QF489_09180 [Planctomycetota bacterium]|jgi:hypothetical protein|nr:hypothetical protein [Planctomycetota bacterium]